MSAQTSPLALSSVEDLTAPLKFHEYVRQHWKDGFHHLPSTKSRMKQTRALFGIEDFLSILYTSPIRGPRWHITIDGQQASATIENYIQTKLDWSAPPSLSDLETLCQNGASFVFNEVQQFSQPLAKFCAKTMQIMGEGVNMNAYFSPANGKRGLGCHYDIQDHFIIQFSGSKRWRFYEGLEHNPIEKVDFSKSSEQRRPDSKGFTDVDVNPGDILYFARGQWHEPVPLDTHSLHLTLTIPRTFQFQLINWLTKRLLQDEKLQEFLPDLTEDKKTQQEWRMAVETVRQEAINTLRSPDFCQRAFLDKFQEAFVYNFDDPNDQDDALNL